jgi:hypothetical protein
LAMREETERRRAAANESAFIRRILAGGKG